MKFEATPIRLIFGADNYKIYACNIDTQKYPDIKLNRYFNVTICGDCGDLTLNMPYDIDAEEKQDKYGYQYQIKYIKQQKPMSTSGLREFLLGCGLSYQQSEEIVREYPNIIELVTNNQTDKIDVSKLYNIGEYRIKVIIERIQNNFMLADLVEKTGGYFSFNIIKKLFDEYGSADKIIDMLENNPYQCLCSINRVGFKTADATLLTLENKINKDVEEGEEPPFKFNNELKVSKDRCIAALTWLLDENEVNGNTIFDIKTVGVELKKLVPECFNYFVEICKTANEDENIKKLIYVDLANKWIANKNTYTTESLCGSIIAEAVNNPIKWDIDISKYKSNGNITLTDEQLNTLQMVCDNNISVLSGNAGSGKSASTLSLIQMLKDNKKNFLLLAPTGRAAKVLSGYTHHKAQTIHKLLFSMNNYEGKLLYDIIIIDESSMMDLSLFYNLLKFIDFTKTKILLVGDPAQLPSVGAGNVLFDIIHCGKVPVNSLTKIFRYGDNGILTVATDIRNSQSYLHKPLGDNAYVFIETQQELMINKVKVLYKTLLEKGYDKEDILILSSYNKGNYGTTVINNILQSIVNKNIDDESKYIIIKNGTGKDTETIKYCIDDIVIQTKNNYKAKVCDEEYNPKSDNGFDVKETFIPNGEIGVVKHITKSSIYIKFNDEMVVYDKADMSNVKLAYSISTHKSQGGNAKIIIFISPKAHTFMLNSNLMYVAITRASEKVFHFGMANTVNTAVKKKADMTRHTWLQHYIINEVTNKQNKTKEEI